MDYDLWAHMVLFAIGKYLEELNLGYMTLSPPFELSFTITEGPRKNRSDSYHSLWKISLITSKFVEHLASNQKF